MTCPVTPVTCMQMISDNINVVDPHWFPCGSGFSFFISNADPDRDPGSQTNADPENDNM
jgi:hypothetical protein